MVNRAEHIDVQLLRWLNEKRKQTVIRGILWRWRATSEDRSDLKQRVRELETGLGKAAEDLDHAATQFAGLSKQKNAAVLTSKAQLARNYLHAK